MLEMMKTLILSGTNQQYQYLLSEYVQVIHAQSPRVLNQRPSAHVQNWNATEVILQCKAYT